MGSSLREARINLHWLSFILIAIFLINYFLQGIGISSAFSRNYLDDLLAMPVIFYLSQLSMRIIYKSPKFKLDKTMLALGFLLVSISFEWFLPTYFEHLTSDLWDIACYAIGSLGFHLMNRLSS
jgi:hypothetical protein